MRSAKPAGQVAGRAAQRLNAGPAMGTDGTNFWVRDQALGESLFDTDFKPDPSATGSIVEYQRSRLKINNGLDKVLSCL